MEILGWVITGGVAAAVVKLLDNVLQWKLKRKEDRSDEAQKSKAEAEAQKEQEFKEVKAKVSTLTTGQMVILHDRIKYLGRAYLIDGMISIDDREDLIDMHNVYHELGGNGNLKVLMQDVLELPLKH